MFGIEPAEDEESDIRELVVPKESAEVIKTMENYLPSMLLLFNWMYEYRNPQKPICIDQYTAERFFYCCHAMVSLYPAI